MKISTKRHCQIIFADHIKKNEAPKRSKCNEMVNLFPYEFHNKS